MCYNRRVHFVTFIDTFSEAKIKTVEIHIWMYKKVLVISKKLGENEISLNWEKKAVKKKAATKPKKAEAPLKRLIIIISSDNKLWANGPFKAHHLFLVS